jgi:topoisomerase (DNA) II binding protein 1
LSGFTTSLLDKVRKILNVGGATRFDQITESVSHVLVAGAELTTEEQRAAMHVQPHVVKAEWLLASIKQGHPANVDPFLCYESQQNTEPSPLSKKVRLIIIYN